MRIEAVTLPTSDARSAAQFWRDLGFPVTEVGGVPTVAVGWTLLRYREVDGAIAANHIAITVPRNRFDDARRWIAPRAELIVDDDDPDSEISGPPWSSRSVYLEGPDNSILELIARGELPIDGSGPFAPNSVVGISEVGLVMQNAEQFVQEMEQTFGLAPFGFASDTFRVCGDQEGLLIGVANGRLWAPLHDRPSGGGFLDVQIGEVARSGEVVSPLGWRVSTVGAG